MITRKEKEGEGKGMRWMQMDRTIGSVLTIMRMTKDIICHFMME